MDIQPAVFMNNTLSNIMCMGIGLACYIVLKRCMTCSSHLKLSWLDCESEALQRIKYDKKKSMLKQIITEVHSETQRNLLNGSIIEHGSSIG